MGDLKGTVNFACQRCLQPIRLDPSFNHLGEHTLAELSRTCLPIAVALFATAYNQILRSCDLLVTWQSAVAMEFFVSI